MIRTVGALAGAPEKADLLARGYEERLRAVAASTRGLPRPKVYFEEWDEPLISGIGWVSELISIAGGDDIFPHLAGEKAARDRIVSPGAVIAGAPDIILASWCGIGEDRAAAGMGCNSGCVCQPHRRDQVAIDSPARPGGADRRARRDRGGYPGAGSVRSPAASCLSSLHARDVAFMLTE